MPGYTYTAKTRTGETKTGFIEAMDEHAVARSLRQEGMLLVSVEETEKKKGSRLAIRFSILQKVSLTERMLFARYLATMIGAGLPMARALEILIEQAASKRLKTIIQEVLEGIRKGQGLAESLARYPDVFSELFVNMFRVGEIGGNLEQVLKLLARQMKKDHNLISRVRGAMIYPAVIFAALIIIGTLMMIFVVPKLAETFEEMDVELPATTQAVMNIAKLAAT